MSSAPTVLYPLTLPGLLNYILTTQSGAAPTTLLVCSSRDTFLQDLSSSLRPDRGEDAARGLEQLLMPTLHNLFTTQHVEVAFCASVQALLAYLTAYSGPGTKHIGDSGKKKRLVLVNPLALHAPTPSFSAQGLSRTFAAAAETAIRADAALLVVECLGKQRDAVREEDTGTVTEDEECLPGIEHDDPWEQEVSILNVSARRFGSSAGEKAWAGRTIKAKRIAGRWLRFKESERHPTFDSPA